VRNWSEGTLRNNTEKQRPFGKDFKHRSTMTETGVRGQGQIQPISGNRENEKNNCGSFVR